MHKRQWVNISDTVLISLRDFQDEKAEVIHRYTAEESRELLKIGELPEKCRVFSQSMDEDEEQEDNGFVIEDIWCAHTPCENQENKHLIKTRIYSLYIHYRLTKSMSETATKKTSKMMENHWK